MVKSSPSKTKPSSSSSSRARIFKGPNPTNPSISPKSKPPLSEPKRFEHVGISHPQATRHSSRLRFLGKKSSNNAANPIQLDFVDDEEPNMALSKGEPTPLSVQPPPTLPSPPPSSHATPSLASSPIPSPQKSASASPLPSSPVSPSPDPNDIGSGSNTDESFVPAKDSSSDDYSYTEDILPPPPSKI